MGTECPDLSVPCNAPFLDRSARSQELGRIMKYLFALFLLLGIASGCRHNDQLPSSLDTLRPLIDTAGMKPPAKDTTQPKADSSQTALPPMTKAIVPDRLAAFLSAPTGWSPQGEIQKENQ